MTREIEVPLPGRSYRIRVGRGSLSAAGGPALRPFVAGRSCALVADDRIAALYLDPALAALEAGGAAAVHPLSFPAGEASKTLRTIEAFYRECAGAGLDRDGVVVALGGGVSGDLAGFLAATWMRGVGFVQLPTSLLAMVDSSVGGKTGVDLPEGKNLVGAFKQPLCVAIDLDVLGTLPPRELRAGLAEVAKYGVALDAELFELLEARVEGLLGLDPELYERVVARCCALKAEVVLADEEDRTGRRALLNLGHTFGHALEQVSGYTALVHGEAVAIGMLMAADLAAARDPALRPLAARQQALFEALGLPTRAPGLAPQAVARAMRADKKAAHGALRLVLPTALGAARLVADATPDEVLAAVAGRCGR